MKDPVVEVRSLTKRYPGSLKPAVHVQYLQIPKGIIFGLLGPNGAGKTTLMSCMTGLVPFTGHIYLAGREVAPQNKSYNKLFGFVPQDFSFYDELSTIENLEFFGAWAGLNKSETKRRS